MKTIKKTFILIIIFSFFINILDSKVSYANNEDDVIKIKMTTPSCSNMI